MVRGDVVKRKVDQHMPCESVAREMYVTCVLPCYTTCDDVRMRTLPRGGGAERGMKNEMLGGHPVLRPAGPTTHESRDGKWYRRQDGAAGESVAPSFRPSQGGLLDGTGAQRLLSYYVTFQ